MSVTGSEGEVWAPLQGRVFNRKGLGRNGFDVNCPGRNLIHPWGVGKRKASANVSDNHTELSMIAININALVSLLFPLRPEVS
jgi:hypothetical protein